MNLEAADRGVYLILKEAIRVSVADTEPSPQPSPSGRGNDRLFAELGWTIAVKNHVSPRSFNASAALMMGIPPNDSRVSKSLSPVTNSRACPARAADSSRAGSPCQSEPEMRVLVSTTSFTRPAIPPPGLHLGGDFLLGHRLAGLRTDSAQHVAEFGGGLAPAQFSGDQSAHGCRFEKAVGPCFVQERVGQIQLDGDAHDTWSAEGYRTDTPRRIAHTAPGRLSSLEPETA